MKKIFSIVILAIVLYGAPGNGQSLCSTDRDDNFAAQFIVSGGSVKMPVGAFLLVRKNGKIGAIRLTSVAVSGQRRRGNLSTNPTSKAWVRSLWRPTTF
jgi:hypothetical protein